MPHRVAAALQADGWYWRSTIIWAKKSPMPESVSGWRWMRCRVKIGKQSVERSYATEAANGRSADFYGQHLAKWAPCPGCNKCRPNDGFVLRRGRWRPTTGHEYLFLFSASANYYCDGDAVQEAAVGNSPCNKAHKGATAHAAGDERMRTKSGLGTMAARETRNPRSVWTLSSEGYKGAHFATYTSELVKRCLMAATPAAGCCPACRTPYAPVVESERIPTRPGQDSKVNRASAHDDSPYHEQNGTIVGNRDPQRHIAVTRIVGYRPSCRCAAGPAVPCLVLDPFLGSGTTSQVATWYGRDAVGCELSQAYAELAEQRIVTMPRCMVREQKRATRPVVVPATPSLFE